MEVNKKYIDIVNALNKENPKKYANATVFFTEVENIGKRLGFNGSWIADVMYIESARSFRTDKKNPNSSATGLIQFMEATAKAMGTTTANLASMTNIQQLKYVESYFKDRIKENKNVSPGDFLDTYLMVFYPVWVNKPDTVFMQDKHYKPNSFIDTKFGNKDGKISKGEFRKYANAQLPGGAVESIKK